jgi:hypothetical protein
MIRTAARAASADVNFYFEVDHGTHFPLGYEDEHTAGLRLLRVAAHTGVEHGAEAVGRLYQAMGTCISATNDHEDTVDRGRSGIVRARYVPADYTTRMDPDDIEAALATLD